MSLVVLLIVAIGLIIVVGCAYWVLSGTSLEGSFRNKAPNLKTCPQCGTPLDPRLDHCPACSLRTSV